MADNQVQPSPEGLLIELRNRVVGRPVSFRRLAANSLLVYVDGEPGSDLGVTFWFEPTWHLRGASRVLTGSREAQEDPDAPEPEAGFRRTAEAVDVLLGREILDVRAEDITGDLHMELEGDLLLRTFVSDPSDEEIWHIRDNVTGTKLYRSGAGFEVRHGE